MTIRRNPITGDPILFAPARASRPRAFGGADPGRCPFCPGHEEDTPPELHRDGDPWRIRLFPNKYPPAEGAEVLVESDRHEDTFDAIDHAADVVRVYAERHRVHADAPYVAVFKNEGAHAGASIPHVHSQIVPLPFVPPRIQREAAAFTAARACPLCGDSEGEMIGQTASWSWLAPFASAMPYQQWIVPRRHLPAFRDLGDAECEELAGLLRSASAAMLAVGDSYNWSFVDFAREPAAHCYVELFPRLTTLAGLEIGTGTFVEIIDPSDAAARLRG